MTNKSYFVRTHSETDPKDSLLRAVKTSDHAFLSDLLPIVSSSLYDASFPEENSKTLLYIAVENEDDLSVEMLVKAGCNPNIRNPILKNYPLHVAARKGNLSSLKSLVDFGKAEVNVTTLEGKTALILLAERLNEKKEYFDCLQFLLLSHSISVNKEDNYGKSALYYAAFDSKEIPHMNALRTLLKSHANPYVEHSSGISLSERLSEIDPNISQFFSSKWTREKKIKDPMDLIMEAYIYNKNDVNKFAESIETVDLNAIPPTGESTILQKASEYGLADYVHVLLVGGASPLIQSYGTKSPVFLASHRGCPTTLKTLLSHCEISLVNDSESILITVLKQPMSGSLSFTPNYPECLRLLLETESKELVSIINFQDELGNTALHYATDSWSESVVMSLLKIGANIGLKNNYGEMPVHKIQHETLENLLSTSCLLSHGNMSNSDFRLTIKYDFLAPPIDSYSSEERIPLPETEVLWHMSTSKTHNYLLKHPVITSFLWMKWKRISGSYYKNLIFTTVFVFLLTYYSFALFAGKSLRTNGLIGEFCSNDTNTNVSTTNVSTTDVTVSWILLSVCLILLSLREILQFGIGPRRYFFSPENWCEVTLISLTTTLVLTGRDPCYVASNRHVAALSVVLSWFFLITLVGRHPKLGTFNIYITMFYTVLQTFITFFLWYSMFIVAFALGFYILLHRDEDSVVKEDENYYPFFDDLGSTVVKTFTMFVGELEFSDLPIHTSFGYLYLLTFIFLIVVVMMNLLNGLAVNDTTSIREQAEIHSYKSQVEVISYIEAMLLGDPFNFLSNWPSYFWLRDIPTCSLGHSLYKVPKLRSIFHKLTGAENILLFLELLPERSITIFPNRDKGKVLSSCFRNKENNNNVSESDVDFPPSILNAAKANLVTKAKEEWSIESRLSNMEKTLENFMKKEEILLQQIYSKLQGVLDKPEEAR